MNEIKSKHRKGLQSRGNTQIDGNFTISVNSTVVTVSKGVFIDVDGTEYNIAKTSKDIGTSQEERQIGIWLFEDSNSQTSVKIGEQKPDNVIQTFVPPDWFQIPANNSDLSTVEMFVFGWIDEHPSKVREKVKEKSGNAVKHSDLQKLKSNGNEIDLEDLSVQKPEKPSSKSSLKVV